MRYLALVVASLCVYVTSASSQAIEGVDLVSAVLDSPRFKGKKPLEKLEAASELIKTNKLKVTDLSFVLLDWVDRYLREPTDPLERLRRWAALTNDDKLGNLRIPRDFLNRTLLAEYLVSKTSYLDVPPYNKLELLSNLEQNKLVDWSVFLAYARLYAGGVVIRAKDYEKTSPLEALKLLGELKTQGLVDWHYKVPTEGLLVAEALAMDKEYQQGQPSKQLAKLKDLEAKGLISQITRKELEKLPAWRLLESDSSFLKATPRARKKRLQELQKSGLISQSTSTDLAAIFVSSVAETPVESKPAPQPERIPPARK
ncbi:MAG: hypothetical protein LDL33_02355 [Desulfomonile sp.]|nr:hypothetical protein [Desulfomonile sp.]